MLGLPGLGQTAHGGRRQAGLGAEELAQGRGEVPGGQSPQIQHRQHLGHLGRAAHIRRQDDRTVAVSLPAVIDSGGFHLDRPRPGRDRPRTGISVADHQAPPGPINQIGVVVEIGLALSEQRHPDHVLSGQAAQLVKADSQLFGIIGHLDGGVMD